MRRPDRRPAPGAGTVRGRLRVGWGWLTNRPAGDAHPGARFKPAGEHLGVQVDVAWPLDRAGLWIDADSLKDPAVLADRRCSSSHSRTSRRALPGSEPANTSAIARQATTAKPLSAEFRQALRDQATAGRRAATRHPSSFAVGRVGLQTVGEPTVNAGRYGVRLWDERPAGTSMRVHRWREGALAARGRTTGGSASRARRRAGRTRVGRRDASGGSVTRDEAGGLLTPGGAQALPGGLGSRALALDAGGANTQCNPIWRSGHRQSLGMVSASLGVRREDGGRRRAVSGSAQLASALCGGTTTC